jgi:uncharacterized protein (TIGR02271 family)
MHNNTHHNRRNYMSIDQSNIDTIIGRPVQGADGQKIGDIGQIYLDDATGKPEWATVRTGLFGTKESFVPVAQAEVTEAGVRVPYDKDAVKDAPRVDADQGHLSQEEEAELYRHYGLTYSEARSDSGLPAGGKGNGRERGTVGHDTSGPSTDDAMTRSEERLEVGTQKREAGRARLRKHVVTEQQTVTVPVTREEVTLEREPITDANIGAATDGPDISEEEHEVVLTEERPVVQKETVPVERVRLGKETVTEQAQVTEDVRKERIEADGVDENRTSR